MRAVYSHNTHSVWRLIVFSMLRLRNEPHMRTSVQFEQYGIPYPNLLQTVLSDMFEDVHILHGIVGIGV